MRNLEEIQALLDKYWSGETTVEEERVLKTYFAGPVVNERFQQFAPLFQTLRQEQQIRLDHVKIAPMAVRSSVRMRWAVAASVVALLGVGAWWLSRPADHSPELAQVPTLPTAPHVPAPAPEVAPLAKPDMMAIAQPAPVRKHTVKTKKAPPVQIDAATEQAMEEIKAALSLVSSKLNKGKKAALKDLNQLENMDKFLKPKSDS